MTREGAGMTGERREWQVRGGNDGEEAVGEVARGLDAGGSEIPAASAGMTEILRGYDGDPSWV